MKYWKAALMCLGAFLIQASLLNLISIKGYTPNLILGLVVVLSFLYESEMYGLVFGATFGCLYDLCFGTVVGPTAIALVLVSIFIFIAREYANIENIVNMWIVSIISIFIFYGFDWVFQRMAGNPIGFVYALKALPLVSIYTFIFITILYLVLVRKVSRHRKDRYFR